MAPNSGWAGSGLDARPRGISTRPGGTNSELKARWNYSGIGFVGVEFVNFFSGWFVVAVVVGMAGVVGK